MDGLSSQPSEESQFEYESLGDGLNEILDLPEGTKASFKNFEENLSSIRIDKKFFISYADSQGNKKNLCIRIGKNTPLFKNIIAGKEEGNIEGVKNLLSKHVSSILNSNISADGKIQKTKILYKDGQVSSALSNAQDISKQVSSIEKKYSLKARLNYLSTGKKVSHLFNKAVISKEKKPQDVFIREEKGLSQEKINRKVLKIEIIAKDADVFDSHVESFLEELKNLDMVFQQSPGGREKYLERMKEIEENALEYIKDPLVNGGEDQLNQDSVINQSGNQSESVDLFSEDVEQEQVVPSLKEEKLGQLDKDLEEPFSEDVEQEQVVPSLKEEKLGQLDKNLGLNEGEELSLEESLSEIQRNAKSIKDLVSAYKEKGESWKDDFSKSFFPAAFFSADRLQPKDIMEDCQSAMSKILKLQEVKKQDEGYVLLKKRIVKANTEVITTGDLHGDAYSLAVMLDKLIEEGKIDPDTYKLQSDVELVFLGDYVDRGPDSWAVLNMLTRLKLNNMEQVNLIRGNHEDVGQINVEGVRFGQWLPGDQEAQSLVGNFFDTLPAAIFLGVEQGENTEYDIYTHGAVPLSFNPLGLHNQEDGIYNVPRDVSLSKKYSFEVLSPGVLADPKSEVEVLASKVNEAVQAYRPQWARQQIDKEWDWGDLSKDNIRNFSDGRGATISLDDFIDWMKYTEKSLSEKIFFNRFFKGHSHIKEEVQRDNRNFYFLDTDLYRKGQFVMHSHKMGNENSEAGFYTRDFNQEFHEGKVVNKEAVSPFPQGRDSSSPEFSAPVIEQESLIEEDRDLVNQAYTPKKFRESCGMLRLEMANLSENIDDMIVKGKEGFQDFKKRYEELKENREKVKKQSPEDPYIDIRFSDLTTAFNELLMSTKHIFSTDPSLNMYSGNLEQLPKVGRPKEPFAEKNILKSSFVPEEGIHQPSGKAIQQNAEAVVQDSDLEQIVYYDFDNHNLVCQENLKEGNGRKQLSVGLKEQNKFNENESFPFVVDDLKGNFPLFRRSRGDGNCYYRSIGQRYFEEISKEGGGSAKLTRLENCIKSLKGGDQELLAAKEIILNMLNCFKTNGYWSEEHRLEGTCESLFKTKCQNERVDLACVKVLRQIAYENVMSECNRYKTFKDETKKFFRQLNKDSPQMENLIRCVEETPNEIAIQGEHKGKEDPQFKANKQSLINLLKTFKETGLWNVYDDEEGKSFQEQSCDRLFRDNKFYGYIDVLANMLQEKPEFKIYEGQEVGWKKNFQFGNLDNLLVFLNRSFEDHFSQQLNTMDECAEQPVFPFLANSLGITLATVLVDPKDKVNKKVHIDFFGEGQFNDPQKKDIIYTLLRPGHFDVLYHKDQLTEKELGEVQKVPTDTKIDIEINQYNYRDGEGGLSCSFHALEAVLLIKEQFPQILEAFDDRDKSKLAEMQESVIDRGIESHASFLGGGDQIKNAVPPEEIDTSQGKYGEFNFNFKTNKSSVATGENFLDNDLDRIFKNDNQEGGKHFSLIQADGQTFALIAINEETAFLFDSHKGVFQQVAKKGAKNYIEKEIYKGNANQAVDFYHGIV